MRTIETEGSWFQLRYYHIWMIGAGITQTINFIVIAIGVINYHDAFTNLKSLLDTLDQTAAVILVINNPVHHYLYIVFVVTVQCWKFIQCINNTVYPGPRKAGPHI